MVTTASYAKKDEAIEMQFWKDLGMWPGWPQGTIKSGLGRQFIAYWGPGPPGEGTILGVDYLPTQCEVFGRSGVRLIFSTLFGRWHQRLGEAFRCNFVYVATALRVAL